MGFWDKVKQANEYREDRDAALPRVEVKTYKDHKEMERDSRSRLAQGWTMEGQSDSAGKTAIGRTAGKAVLTGGVGLLIAGRSKKGAGITVTWRHD